MTDAVSVDRERVGAAQIHRGRRRRVHHEPAWRRPNQRVYRATHELQTMLCRAVRQQADSCSRFDLDAANVCDFDRGLRLIVGLEPGAGAELTLIDEWT